MNQLSERFSQTGLPAPEGTLASPPTRLPETIRIGRVAKPPPGPPITVTHFVRRPRALTFSLERVFQDVRDHLPPGFTVSVCRTRFHSRGVVRRLLDAVRASWYQADVNHITGDVHFLTIFLQRRKTVLTIADCVPLTRSTGLRRWILWFFWYWLPTRRSAIVTVISEDTRRQLLEFTGCEPDRVRVIHCGVSDEFQPFPRPFDTQCPRILHVGTKANKNLERHAEALAGINCQLIIIGEPNEAQREALERHGVRWESRSRLTREELVDEYRRCDLLLFASLYEGFGLPIVEAQAVGRPVITSSQWSMPEVARDAAILVDPLDVSDIRAAVVRLITDEACRAELVARGYENVVRFRPAAIAERYAGIYRELAG
jgi:glycosyltransferase involved in cell wall biosynthesis